MGDGTCPRVEGVCIQALVRDATPGRQRSSLTICSIGLNKQSAYIEHTRHPLAAVPLGIIDEKCPLFLVTMNTFRQVPEPYYTRELTDSARAAT